MNVNNIHIRETMNDDFQAIMEVEKQGFGYDKEAELVAQLLDDKTGEPIISLLAFHNNEAIGHILFTKAIIEGSNTSPLIHILAPLAVKPAFQKKGIGGMLIREGLNKLKKIGSEMVFVFGSPQYYPKFGFITGAESLGFPALYPLPPELADAWMIQALSSEGLSAIKGRIICATELNKLQHWRE